MGVSRSVDHESWLRELYAGCYPRLVAQLTAVTGDQQVAQDAVQEAFLRAVNAPRRIVDLDNPEAWLRTVAVNWARSRWRRLRRADVLLGIGRAAPRDAAQQPPLSPDRVALFEALRRLPTPQRECLALHYIADLPVAEIAATLRVPEGTVKARLSRGRARLAELLADDPDRSPQPSRPEPGETAREVSSHGTH